MSGTLPTPDDRIKSGKELAGIAMELQEHEIKLVVGIVNVIREKYAGRSFTVANLDALRDEVLHRLAAINVLASVDVAPCLHGEPPVIEIVGKLGDVGFQQEFDHERKRHDILKANERGESYLGQTGEADAAKAKRRNRA